MASPGCIAIYILGFLGGLLWIIQAVSAFLFVQRIRNTPTSKVGAAALGLVELYGKVRPFTEEDKSPISGIPCGYWKIRAFYWHSGKNSGWRHFYSKESAGLFYVEDDSGRILVDSEGAKISISPDATFEGRIFDYPDSSSYGGGRILNKEMDKRVLDFVNNLEPGGKKAFLDCEDKKIRIEESFVADGDKLYIIGNAEPLEGAVSPVGSENLVVRKGRNMMFISESPEVKVTREMDRSIQLGIVGGLVVAALCLLLALQTLKEMPYN